MSNTGKCRMLLGLIALLICFVMPMSAQSPNTSSIFIVVLDPSGAAVKDAKISVLNSATGALRETMSGNDGSATISALSLTGAYTVTVTKLGFASEEREGVALRSGETATLLVKLRIGEAASAEVTVYGTAEGVRTDLQTEQRFESQKLDELPILGRKITTVPLLNSAFRQGKGLGDLYMNQTYSVAGAGSRRATTVTLDGANNDEPWGRQASGVSVPVGSIQEFAALSNAFSPEFGWTSGPALNIVTKSGTNTFHGEGLFMARPGDMQAKSFSTKNFCAPSVSTCVTPAALTGISPVDIPDSLKQTSAAIGGPIIKDKTFFFGALDYTAQDRTTFLSSSLPSFLLPANGQLDWTGHYRQALFDARVDHKLTPGNDLMFRFNSDRFYDDNPQDSVGGTSAPSVARRFDRRSWTTQLNLTSVINPSILNEARFAFLDGTPVANWTTPNLSTTYTRSGTVPFTIGQSRLSDFFARQAQFSDTLSWSHGKHTLRFGGSAAHHNSGGSGSEFGTAVLGTFTFKNTTTAPFDQLTLADVQNYTQPINFGISSYEMDQWLLAAFIEDLFRLRNDFSLDLGLRYDRQTLTDATRDFAPRVGFAWNPWGNSRMAVRGGFGMYYTPLRTNIVAGALTGGLDGLTTYTAVSGQLGFPTCLTGSCLPLSFDPKTLPASQLPARDITISPGKREFYTTQFAKYGLDFSKLPSYPDKLVNPKSKIVSVGSEYELTKGLFLSSDYVHQHWTDLDRSIDLNAPSRFDRTAPGQVRTVAAANATRPILPVNGGIRQVNVIMNLGVADYDGWQTQLTFRGNRRLFASLSYTLSKATNTTEPDGNGVGPDQGNNILLVGESERGPSLVDQRHRAVIAATYQLPYHFNVGTLASLASARPFNATTGIDNNGDGTNNDRPVINGKVVGKSTFRGTATSEISLFLENRLRLSDRMSLNLRIEGFNLLNHGNYLGRGQTTYGDTGTPNATFGQVVNLPTGSNVALPAFANIDPPRMFQLQARFVF